VLELARERRHVERRTAGAAVDELVDPVAEGLRTVPGCPLFLHEAVEQREASELLVRQHGPEGSPPASRLGAVLRHRQADHLAAKCLVRLEAVQRARMRETGDRGHENT
jgi:hypothetical protein